MGKNLIQQARGKGGPRYRANSFHFKGRIQYPGIAAQKGTILELIHCAGHSAPLARVQFDTGERVLLAACEGMCVGSEISAVAQAPVEPGNIFQLKDIPEGTLIYNVELQPGDGGKLCRCSGIYARVTARLPDRIMVMLPSKKERSFLPECRAMIGIVAGGGRPEKPFYKAGNKHHRMQAKNKLYPHVKGIAMNAVDHPFGGSRSSKKNKPSTTSRDAPPGRKVGLIAARRTGRK